MKNRTEFQLLALRVFFGLGGDGGEQANVLKSRDRAAARSLFLRDRCVTCFSKVTSIRQAWLKYFFGYNFMSLTLILCYPLHLKFIRLI
jgi:hypothetical protein